MKKIIKIQDTKRNQRNINLERFKDCWNMKIEKNM